MQHTKRKSARLYRDKKDLTTMEQAFEAAAEHPVKHGPQYEYIPAEDAPLPPSDDIDPDSETISVDQVARSIGVSNTHVYKMINAGTFPIPSRRFGKRYIIFRADYEEYMSRDGVKVEDTRDAEIASLKERIIEAERQFVLNNTDWTERNTDLKNEVKRLTEDLRHAQATLAATGTTELEKVNTAQGEMIGKLQAEVDAAMAENKRISEEAAKFRSWHKNEVKRLEGAIRSAEDKHTASLNKVQGARMKQEAAEKKLAEMTGAGAISASELALLEDVYAETQRYMAVTKTALSSIPSPIARTLRPIEASLTNAVTRLSEHRRWEETDKHAKRFYDAYNTAMGADAVTWESLTPTDKSRWREIARLTEGTEVQK